MGARYLPESLYIRCLDFCIPRLEGASRAAVESDVLDSLDKLNFSGRPIVEDLLLRAFQLANREKPSGEKRWRDEWRIFYTGKISSAILSWDESLIAHVGNRCKNLKTAHVVHWVMIDLALVPKCPQSLITLDFDGELVNRGKLSDCWDLGESSPASWLGDSDKILRSLLVAQAKVPQFSPEPGTLSLSEIHLGNVQTKADDLAKILVHCKNLRLLKHYQLASALYKLHSDAWRKKQQLPVYNLRNIDVDFSHVVRCRMSPEWVLSPDALHLVVRLCPRAKSVRVRFDCSTPNDALAPLVQLEAIKEYSAVCVSSGERSLIDFADMSPILEKHGPKSLTYLELKVIEEVEIHSIIENCTKLDTLVLSGCGYVTPATCSSYDCRSYATGSLKKLRFLFYADGDDFSWDHGVPECFWKATMLPSGMSHVVRLQGIFLEYPRIPRPLTKLIFSPGKRRLPFPNLVAVSFCRFEEITVEDVSSICGLSEVDAETVPCHTLRYVRLSDCEKIGAGESKRLKTLLKHSPLKELRLSVDR
ncbi:UNVERIFIED_CONTAM: hypothetical protein PYX00_006105 [Menopon gallinae]|uniref:F-box/RNI-like superfamily protein n=1 Tax=Menopon gallinae TaxID=328185 RepID=A0AAW2HU22_9NEOP